MQVYDPYQALLQCFARFPDHEGLVFPETGRRLTFAQWLHDVHALASALRHAGIRPGERVAIWAENRIEWPVAQVAIAAIGAVMVPVNTHFRAEDVRHVLTHAGVAAILLSERFRANEYRSIIESLRPQLKHLRVVVNFDGFAVRSPGTLSYHDDPVETDRTIDSDGWMQTGDLGCLRHDGRVELVGGRLRDVIIRGGENVYPVEVENLLREHPDIREIAVFAVPDHYYGEIVAAAIESDALLTPADLRQFCRGRIAGFKHPARVFSVSEWPMTSSGKIIKRQLQVAAKEGRLKELT